MTNTIALLTYMNRSGSTLLARMLDEYREIEVSVEGDVPDGILVPWMEVSSKDDIIQIIESLRARTKLHYWNLDYAELERRMFSLTCALTPAVLARELLKMHFNDSPAPIYLFKRGKYIEAADMAHKVFEGAKIVFVMRDLHAIFNSYKRTKSSMSGKLMGSNPITVALEYREIMNHVRKHYQQRWFKMVRYEDLIRRSAAEVEAVLVFLGIEGRGKKRSTYANSIPSEQKHLHRNIGNAPDPHRINAWRKNLSMHELFCLRAIARKQLQWAGYQCELSSLGLWRSGPIFLFYCFEHWFGVFIRLCGLCGMSQASATWQKLITVLRKRVRHANRTT